jgi:hypothetical protein
MVVFNYSGGEVNAKIVYYGPGLSGKTTNLEYIYAKMPSRVKGKMISMKTRTDRTLFFDFLPLELGDVNGFKIRFLLYTVPGQVYYNATRKLVLKGADAVVFVADSDPTKIQENIESLKNLEENLNEHNLSLDTIPWVMQYNKRDLPNAMPVAELEKKLNVLKVPSFEAVATEGKGVYETFQMITRLLYQRVHSKVIEEESSEALAGSSGTGDERSASAEAGATEDTGTVTEVVEVALREVGEAKGKTGAAAGQTTQDGEPKQESPADIPLQTNAYEEDGATTGASEKGPESRGDDSGKDEFQFASLRDLEVDKDMGRVVDLDSSVETGEVDEQNDFITDPCRPSAAGDDAAEEKAAGREEAMTPLSSGEEISLSVPVVITRSQVKKNIPLKLVLEIQVIDED